jgi:hypothetical protein
LPTTATKRPPLKIDKDSDAPVESRYVSWKIFKWNIWTK